MYFWSRSYNPWAPEGHGFVGHEVWIVVRVSGVSASFVLVVADI